MAEVITTRLALSPARPPASIRSGHLHVPLPHGASRPPGNPCGACSKSESVAISPLSPRFGGRGVGGGGGGARSHRGFVAEPATLNPLTPASLPRSGGEGSSPNRRI